MRRVGAGHNAQPPAPPLATHTKVSSDGGANATSCSAGAATGPGRAAVPTALQAESANTNSNNNNNTTTMTAMMSSNSSTATGITMAVGQSHHTTSRAPAQPTASRTPLRSTPHHTHNKVHFSVDGEVGSEALMSTTAVVVVEAAQSGSPATGLGAAPPPPTQTTAVPSAAEQQQCLMHNNINNSSSGHAAAGPMPVMMMTTGAMSAAGHGTARVVRDALSRPAMALSARIMTVYKNINLKFCAERRQQMPGTKYNNGYDDASGHYIPIIGEEIASRYTVQEVLGKGSFGIVLRCCDEKYQEPVAMKIIRSGPYFEAQGALEAEIVAYLNKNPALENRVVQLRKAFIWQGHIALVFELLSFNLYQLIRCTKYNGVSLDLTRKFAYQLLQVLLQLEQHDPPIIHCDLKPENVVLRDPNRSGVRVIDFGSSCYQPVREWAPPSPVRSLRQEVADEGAAPHRGSTGAAAEQTSLTNSSSSSTSKARQRYRAMPRYIQSRFYRSPEVILELGYTTAIDRWSLGCMLVELHTGVPLFPGRNEADMMSRFVAVLGPLPEFMLAVSPKLHTFYDVIRIPTTTTAAAASAASAVSVAVTSKGTQVVADDPALGADESSKLKHEVAVQAEGTGAAETSEPTSETSAPLPHTQAVQRGTRHRHVDPLAEPAGVAEADKTEEADKAPRGEAGVDAHEAATAAVTAARSGEGATGSSSNAAAGEEQEHTAATEEDGEGRGEAAGAVPRHAVQPASQPLSSVGPASGHSSASPPPPPPAAVVNAATADENECGSSSAAAEHEAKVHTRVQSSPTASAGNADAHRAKGSQHIHNNNTTRAASGNGSEGSSTSGAGHRQVYYALKQGPDPAHVHTLEEIIGVHNGGPRGCRRGQPGHDVTTYLTFLDFIKSLLEYDPRRRMSCAEALRHPFLLPLLELEARATAMHQQQQHLQLQQQQQRRKAAAAAAPPEAS